MQDSNFDPINLKNTMLELIEILTLEISLIKSGSKLTEVDLQQKETLAQSALLQNNLLTADPKIRENINDALKNELRELARELQNVASLNTQVLHGALIFSTEVINLVNEYIAKHYEKARVYDSFGRNKGAYLKKMPFSISINDNI
ncbi:MAG: hypothetical protein ACK5WS_03620 [Alphaproteobacteria bacterium]|jgi:hypothetical protein|nr:hypothetical protein [Candidatus Jidaibacter sp.]